MKKQLTIGKFAAQHGLTARTLRVYESWGLIPKAARGDNGYRVYSDEHLQRLGRIQNLKAVGFDLRQIKALLNVNEEMNSSELESFFRERLREIQDHEAKLKEQRLLIEKILPRLQNPQTNRALDARDRKYIMRHFEKIKIVVAGTRDLDLTAQNIQTHLHNAGATMPLTLVTDGSELTPGAHGIFVIHESKLNNEDLRTLSPDVVVIKELSKYSSEIENNYLNLYQGVGPTMATIFNADDRAAVQLAANATIRKGKTYYFSRNSGLEAQIERIGGLVCAGGVIRVFGFNRTSKELMFQHGRILGSDEETALLASIAAVLDIGLNEQELLTSLG